MKFNFNQPLNLTPTIQNYSWGKIGSDSFIWRLINGEKPSNSAYAELWVGTHQKSPAKFEGRSLLDLVMQNPEAILGNARGFDGGLPFLFKILSVGSALSIQAHPNKELATKLHFKDSIHYPDSNHKPEVGVAITTVQLLYGFRPTQAIKDFFHKRSYLKQLLSNSINDELELSNDNKPAQLVKAIFIDLLKSDQKLRSSALDQLKIELTTTSTSTNQHEKLFIELSKKHPLTDVGLVTLFLLNLCELRPGEAFYIGPNLPHAYLSGDLVEVMANSDNVVRAGLTSKYQDFQTLIEMLSYEPVSFLPIQPIKVSHLSSFYKFPTPASEFEIQFTAATSQLKEEIYLDNKVELLFCLSGNGEVSCVTNQQNTVRQGTERQKIVAGTALLLPACLERYRLEFSGGVLFRVVVP